MMSPIFLIWACISAISLAWKVNLRNPAEVQANLMFPRKPLCVSSVPSGLPQAQFPAQPSWGAVSHTLPSSGLWQCLAYLLAPHWAPSVLSCHSPLGPSPELPTQPVPLSWALGHHLSSAVTPSSDPFFSYPHIMKPVTVSQESVSGWCVEP